MIKINVSLGDNIMIENLCDVKSQNALLREIGKAMYNFHLENKEEEDFEVFAKDDFDKTIASFRYKKRGTYLLEGNEYPSLHCCNQFLNTTLPFRKYNAKDLRCINLDGNNYKKYFLDSVDNKNDDLHIRYGSIDVPKSNCREVVYPNYMFWILYYEKLSKGYKDFSSILTISGKDEKENVLEEKVAIEAINPNDELYKLLYNFSKGFVERVLMADNITLKQCEKSEKLFEELKTKKTVKGFNSCLTKLMVISPRKRNIFCRDKIKDYCARSEEDFSRIINFEETLLNSMMVVCNKNVTSKEKVKGSFLDEFGIEVFEATDKQKNVVMKHLNALLQQKVKKIYRVIPRKQSEVFGKYCKDNNINEIKLLWHGSPNPNWFSILSNSLKITKQVAHGRMFGNGIYFALSSDKSYGYTSSYGSRWANGNSKVAIMGLYATAYGNPYMIKCVGASYEDESSIKNRGCDCLHATPSNTGLRADEIIYYNENAVCLNYIVVFEED